MLSWLNHGNLILRNAISEKFCIHWNAFIRAQARSQEHMQPTGLLDILPEINECFRYDNVESVIAAVQHSTSAWAREAKKQLSG